MTQTTHIIPGHPIDQFLNAVQLGAPARAENLTVWPLQLRQSVEGHRDLPFALLAEALDQGTAEIDEVSDGGEVPHVRVRNRGAVALLVLFGELLVGAKQNRIANASFLVAPGQDLVIDVSCVEQGRWSDVGRSSLRRRSARFASSDSLVSHRIRRKMAMRVSQSRAAGMGYHADQLDVWSDVRESLASEQVSSPTSSYRDYSNRIAPRIEEIRRAIPALPLQVGFAAAVDEEMIGLEAIGDADAFARAYPRMLDAYATDALYALKRGRPTGPRVAADPAAFISMVRGASIDADRSLGLGEDVRLGGGGVEGCALLAGGLVHMTASPAV